MPYLVLKKLCRVPEMRFPMLIGPRELPDQFASTTSCGSEDVTVLSGASGRTTEVPVIYPDYSFR